MASSTHVSRPAYGASQERATESAGVHLSSEDPAAASRVIADLAGRAMAGDRDAVEQLLLNAQEVAWRFSKTVCGHTEDAEDVMQEALVQTFRFISRLRDAHAFRPWLYRTVRNACLMNRRRRVGEPRHLASLDELLPAPDGGVRRLDAAGSDKNPEQLVVNAALRRRLTKALKKLPPPFRLIVFLREMEGLSTRETAEAAGVSEDTVKARLHRARVFLQRELAGPGERDAPTRRPTTRRRTVARGVA